MGSSVAAPTELIIEIQTNCVNEELLNSGLGLQEEQQLAYKAKLGNVLLGH